MLMDQGDCNTVVKTAAIVCNLQIAADARLQGTIGQGTIGHAYVVYKKQQHGAASQSKPGNPQDEEQNQSMCDSNVNTPALGMLATLVPALPAGLQCRYCAQRK